ncbi:hypothetical protein MG293_005927 [Ovis ammon polii]|uniref:Uncharacterized protein n=1 Tax=Ovis ammon polii TaxID=230172 RepID=A0AAD4UGM4_OVIAM|nr:hypothetical protein MG293_005927 [Ovis ammon polii]
MAPTKKGSKKKGRSAIDKVVNREYTINVHKHIYRVEGESNSVPECPWKLYLGACFPMICPACPGDVVHPEANRREEKPWHQHL